VAGDKKKDFDNSLMVDYLFGDYLEFILVINA
jgi:hypothetical protein